MAFAPVSTPESWPGYTNLFVFVVLLEMFSDVFYSFYCFECLGGDVTETEIPFHPFVLARLADIDFRRKPRRSVFLRFSSVNVVGIYWCSVIVAENQNVNGLQIPQTIRYIVIDVKTKPAQT